MTATAEVFGSVFVDSTKPGRNPAVLNDGDTTDSPSAPRAWRSEDTVTQHFAGLAVGSLTGFGKLIFYMPTRGDANAATGMSRFKVQVGDGVSWIDAAPTMLSGAVASATPGWLSTVSPPAHQVTVEFGTIFGTHIRVLMDVNGGSFAHPNTMWLNEIRAFAVGAATVVSSFSFDDNGNMVSRTTGAIVENYGYNYRNELATYARTSAGVTESAFMYKFGPRAGDRINKANLVSGVTEWYMMEVRDTVADYETMASSLVFAYKRRYVNSLGINSKVARIESSGATFWYSGDALGSVGQTLNASQGIVNQQQADAWGVDLQFSQGVADRYGFTSRERDEGGLMHYRARAYVPALGRFAEADPAMAFDAPQRFVYVRSRATQLVDPLGLQETAADRKAAVELGTQRAHVQELGSLPWFDYFKIGWNHQITTDRRGDVPNYGATIRWRFALSKDYRGLLYGMRVYQLKRGQALLGRTVKEKGKKRTDYENLAELQPGNPSLREQQWTVDTTSKELWFQKPPQPSSSLSFAWDDCGPCGGFRRRAQQERELLAGC